MATWIFQGNPDTFDLDGYLRAEPVIMWPVRQHHLADRITVGDRVFIWRAQGSGKEPAGVIAAGFILEPPRGRLEQDAALPFWRTPPAGEALRAVIRIERRARGARGARTHGDSPLNPEPGTRILDGLSRPRLRRVVLALATADHDLAAVEVDVLDPDAEALEEPEAAAAEEVGDEAEGVVEMIEGEEDLTPGEDRLKVLPRC